MKDKKTMSHNQPLPNASEQDTKTSDLQNGGLRELLENAEKPSPARHPEQDSAIVTPLGKRATHSPAEENLQKRKIRARTLKLDRDQLHAKRILVDGEVGHAGVAYKVLRTKVYKAFGDNGWSSVGITSANPAEGKTTTAINLAYAFARAVRNVVVLVDFDFHRPNVHNTLGFNPPAGIIDYLRGDVLISEVLYRVEGTDLFVIPGRLVDDLPLDMMSNHAIPKFHQLLKGMFPSGYIFYDLPPVLHVDDALVFEDKDCNLLIAAEGDTSIDDLHHAMELLSGQNMLGYVLNKSRHGSRISKYGYTYYGYGSYGGYGSYSGYPNKA